MSGQHITQSSQLAVPPERVLSELTMRNVNAELKPLATMTMPDEWADRPIAEWPVQQPLFSSWVLLLGLLPIDRHHMRMHRIIPEQGFEEDSSTSFNRFWRHTRHISKAAGGCQVTDSIEYQSRIPGLDILLRPIYALVFRRRHRQLKSKYGCLN